MPSPSMAANISSWVEASPLTHMDAHSALQAGVALLLGALILVYTSSGSKAPSHYPLLNPAAWLDLTKSRARSDFRQRSTELLKQGRTQYKGKPFRMNTEAGEVVFLPNSFVNDIRNDPNLSLTPAIAEDFHAHLPGFEAFATGQRADALIQKMVRKQLVRSLNKVTEPLSQETGFATELSLGKPDDWEQAIIYPKLLDIVARISSRVFLGPEVCRNEEWLTITKSYTLQIFSAAQSLRSYPKWSRSIVHWFHEPCKSLRVTSAKATSIITPVIEERKRARAEAVARGENPTYYDDAIDWLEDESNGAPYEAAASQLGLSMAAIHTTTDLLTETLLRLARRPELVEELRAEITEVLRAHGWKKTSLYNMTLLDSVIKECQRLRPLSEISITRKATGDVTLPNGDVLRKGTRIVCLTEQRQHPAEFDPYRFQKQRGTDAESAAHLVSTGPASLGFGHGSHACPGRFFAANELKVALCHLIVKYDWSVPEGASPEPEPLHHSLALNVDPRSELRYKIRATPELDIDSVSA